VLGYVPVQIIDLSLEEVEKQKHVTVGVASTIKVSDAQVIEQCTVNSIQVEHNIRIGEAKSNRRISYRITHALEIGHPGVYRRHVKRGLIESSLLFGKLKRILSIEFLLFYFDFTIDCWGL
jgi:hypothetical protein